jgi:hypothetical protein
MKDVMQDTKPTGFPGIHGEEEEEFMATRPMPIHEIPVQARIDSEMAIIAQHHERIAKAIKLFWGHRDCGEYLHKLILSGGDNAGKTRVGFKPEVLTALINLTNLHDIAHG